MSGTGFRGALTRAGFRCGALWAAGLLGDLISLRRGGRGFAVTRRRRDRFLVLTFHRVAAEPGGFKVDAVPLPLFDAMMGYVAKRFTVLPLDAILDLLASEGALPRRTLAVTFDDGYEDNVLHALPVLRRHGIGASFFLTAGCVERGEGLWFDRVFWAFERLRDGAVVEARGSRTPIRTEDERYRAAVAALLRLLPLPPDRRTALMESLFDELGVEVPAVLPSQLMSWEQARLLKSSGMTLGSHTLTHPNLASLEPGVARHELVASKRLIEERTGARVRLLAYPYGKPEHYSPSVLEAVRAAGYEAALTTSHGVNLGTSSPFELRRIPSLGRDLASFAAILTQFHLDAGAA